MEYRFEKATWIDADPEDGELLPQNIEKMHDEIEAKIRGSIEQLIESRENLLGEGMTAEVHFLENDSKLCYKIMRKTDVMVRPDMVENLPEKYRLVYEKKKAAQEKARKQILPKGVEGGTPWHVDLFTEAGYLSRARTVDPEGPVKIPRPDARIEIRGREEGDGFEITDDLEVLLMETMDAVSVDDLMRKGGLPPDGFDYEKFCAQIQDFIASMHERKLYHRDLHAGNVMVERGTGRPVIIDFGRSGLSTEEEAYIEEVRPGQKMHFIRDEQMFRDKVKIPFGQYLEYRKLTNIK
jgi:serine/threonine protein kinase